MDQVAQLKHKMYFSNQQTVQAEINLNDSNDKRPDFYQHYLDIDIDGDGKNGFQDLPKTKVHRLDLVDEYNIANINERTDEISETRQETSYKKPHTAVGILGRDGGVGLLRSQPVSSMSNKDANLYKKQKTPSQQYIPISSPQLTNQDNYPQSPLGFAGIQGYKTPTSQMQSIELSYPVKYTMKGNYQTLLAPVIELNAKGQNNDSLRKKASSRNDDFKSNKTQQKTSQTIVSMTGTTGNGINQKSIDEGMSNDTSSYSKNSMHQKITHIQQKGINSNKYQYLDQKRSTIESPNTGGLTGYTTSANILFQGTTSANKKASKKNKKHSGLYKAADKNRKFMVKSQQSQTNLKNYQSVPQINTAPGQNNQTDQKQTANIQTLKSQNVSPTINQAYTSICGVGQPKSSQGFSQTQFFESKYRTTGGGSIALKQELSCLLASSQRGQDPTNSQAKKQNDLNLSKQSLKNSYASTTNNPTKQTPKSSFTQVINITQNQTNSLNSKSSEIFLQQLNEKSKEIINLKSENKQLTDRLQQAEKELIYLQSNIMSSPQPQGFKFTPSAANNYMVNQPGQVLGQKKHSKTLSLKDSNAEYLMDLKLKYLDNIEVVSPEKNIQSTKNYESLKLQGQIEGIYQNTLTPNDKESRNPFSTKQKFSIPGQSIKNNDPSVSSFQSQTNTTPNDKERYAFLCKLQDQSKASKFIREKKRSMDIAINNGLNQHLDIYSKRPISPINLVESQAKVNSNWTNPMYKSTYDTQHAQNASISDFDSAKDLSKIKVKMTKVLQGYKERERALVMRVQELENMLGQRKNHQ